MENELELKGRYKLTKPWVKTELVRFLAEGKRSQTELAKRYGVGQSAIAEFKRRHESDIESIKDSLNDEWVGLWVADKRKRIEVLQAQIEAMYELPTGARNSEVIKMLLRSVAEELGDITNKNKVEVESYRYEIVGINLEDLQ